MLFSYEQAPGGEPYIVSNLKIGIYDYQAKATISGKLLTDQGQFIVDERQIEFTDLKARHDILKQLSERSEGIFYHLKNYEELLDQLKSKKLPQLARTQERFEPLHSLWYILLILLALLGTEWFLRKYHGLY